MNSVLAETSNVTLKREIVAFVKDASIEITPHDNDCLPLLVDQLLPKTTIYVTHTPKASLDDVIRVASKIEGLGFRACPHIVARRIPSVRVLREAVRELRDNGIEQLMLVAGDSKHPMGGFVDTLQVLESGCLTNLGIKRIGICGHPEGHKAVGPNRLRQALV